MTLSNPNFPETWPNAYSREQAFRDAGLRRIRFVLIVFAAIVIAFLYMAFFLYRYHIFGAVSDLAFLTMTLVVILFILAAFLLLLLWAFRLSAEFITQFHQPPEGVDPRAIVFYRLFGRFQFPAPFNMLSRFMTVRVNNGVIENSDQWPAWMACNLGGPLTLTIFDGSALYLERGNRFSRVVGPGTTPVFLEWYETIKTVVDLRPKVQTGSFTVWTRDGIQAKLTVRIVSRIGNPAGQDPAISLVYPFNAQAVQLAVERTSLRWSDPTKEPTEFTWMDAAWGQVTTVLPEYIGGHNLDDLLIAERQGGQILSQASLNEIITTLNGNVIAFGVFITDLQILALELPEEVNRFHEEFWKAERESQSTIIDGEAKAFKIRMQEKARADAQRDIILAVAEGLEKNPKKQYIESLLLSLSGMLDDSLGDPLARAYLAKESLDTLEKIKKLLNLPDTQQGTDKGNP